MDEEKAKEFAEVLNEKFGTKNIAVYGDITNPQDIEKTLQKAEEVYGGVDILVNNAGVWPTGTATM